MVVINNIKCYCRFLYEWITNCIYRVNNVNLHFKYDAVICI